MAEARAKPLKKEEEGDDDEDDLPLSSRSRAKSVKKEDLDDEDDVRLAFSKSRLNKSKSPPAKVKKEVDDDKDQKVKKRGEEGKSKVKPADKVNKKQPDYSDYEFLQDKKKTSKTTNKREEKKVAGKKGGGPDANGKVKVKKVYDLPGQKHDPPVEREPLRIFYESLYNQVPGSEMAAFWMMEWGLLPLAEAKKVYEKKKGNEQRLRSAVKAVVSVKLTPTAMAKTGLKTDTSVSKKRLASESDDDDDDDFIASRKTKKQRTSS